MPKWIWVIFAIIISSTIYFSIRYGLRPKPIPLMKPTSFSSFEEMGVVSARRLFQPIRSEKVIVLGHDPENVKDTLMIWQGVLKAAIESKITIRKIYHDVGETELPEYFSRFEAEKLDPQNLTRIKEDLLNSRRRQGVVVFMVPTKLATHLRNDSLTKKLEASALGPVFSISQADLETDPKVLEEISLSCVDLDPNDFESRLNCIEFKYAKSQWRRKPDPSKILGAIERYGLKEYLLFTHRPAESEIRSQAN